MRAIAGLWAAASAAATAWRMEGMSSGLLVGGGWLGGPGRDLAARQADLVGSGEGGRRRAAFFVFGPWLGRGPAMLEVVWVGVCGGKQFAWTAFGGHRGWAWVCWGVCGGVCWPVGGVGVPLGLGLLAVGVCGLPGVGGGEGCPASGSVAGVCGCLCGWGRPVSRGPGVCAMTGVCGPPAG